MNREKMTIDEAMAIIRKEYLCVDRDCDIEQNCGKCDLMMPSKEPILEAYKMAIKALEQMPVTTTAGEGGVIYYPQVEGVTPTVISAGKQEPCEDLISRQAVQDYIAKYLSQYLYNDVREAVEVIDEYIGELPSVNPQPKTGHWISHHHGCEYECSECHDKQRAKSNYCPNCGARMVEPQERSDKE